VLNKSNLLISIGIVTWNSATHLPCCLKALSAQNDVTLELIVIDNASDDQSVELVLQYFPDARVIRNTNNTGFCHAHNQAISAAKGKYYMALNPDVVMMPDYISKMVTVLEEKPDYGSIAGKLMQTQGGEHASILDSTGLFIDRQRRQYLRGHGEMDTGQFDQASEVFGVDGAAPLYRREMLEDIKIDGQYFDESFFAHKEDVDLAWRARLLGWRCWYTPEAVAVHPRGFRPGQKREVISPAVRVHAVKNRYLLLKKHESSLGWRRDGMSILWYDLKILGYLCLFERSSLKAFSLLCQVWHLASEWRREIWKRVRVEPAEMLGWFK
jgi:GT2 family glycosyltransferase